MMTFVTKFLKDEDGAVTVDWVVLTAAVVGLAVAAYGSIETATNSLTADTAGVINGQVSTPAASPSP